MAHDQQREGPHESGGREQRPCGNAFSVEDLADDAQLHQAARFLERRDELGAAALARQAGEGQRHHQAELTLPTVGLEPVDAAGDGGEVGHQDVF